MRYIYVDKFRSFENQIIPMYPVTFFVGENSTGKSSILSLINLMSDLQFWISGNFSNNMSKMDYFSDITWDDNKEFTIGYAEINGENVIYYLSTFKDVDGFPFEYKYTSIKNKSICTCIYEQGKTVLFSKQERKDKKNKISFSEAIRQHNELDFSDRRKTIIDGEFENLPVHLSWGWASKMSLLTNKHNNGLNSFNPLPRTLIQDISWIAPMRSEGKRVYEGFSSKFSPSGEHTPFILKTLLDRGKEATKTKRKLTKFGRESGLFEKLSVKKHGKGVDAPFQINPQVNGKPNKLTNVGFGVAQSLPVATEIIYGEDKDVIGIQQPEVHLHPKAQAAMGDLIANAARQDGKQFIIETHSDYLINRFRINAKNNNEKIEAAVIFFEHKNANNSATPIKIEPDGSYPEDQPPSFRDFFIREELELLGI